MNWNHYFGITAAVWLAPHTPPIVSTSIGCICVVLQIVSIYADNKK